MCYTACCLLEGHVLIKVLWINFRDEPIKKLVFILIIISPDELILPMILPWHHPRAKHRYTPTFCESLFKSNTCAVIFLSRGRMGLLCLRAIPPLRSPTFEADCIASCKTTGHYLSIVNKCLGQSLYLQENIGTPLHFWLQAYPVHTGGRLEV